ncbi:hypothetical protein C8Q80DRAFT_1184964 [Daedaleopsis nitida]|nr:hypothetical protein C8Q80DRAFT_1184964 [Daedaleopsis nitida]
MSIRLGRIVLTIVALVTSFGGYIADWNDSHIYNPIWTGHAKFHNGQTMSMGLLLGFTALWYLYASSTATAPAHAKTLSAEAKATRKAAAKANLRTAVLLDSLYWITQASAYFYPGVTAFDVLPGKEDEVQDPMLQAKLEASLLTLAVVGWWLENRRINSAYA